MASNEKFCLRWNDFESNMSVAFRDLRDEKDFFDVTLAVDDAQQVHAHKVILSACSPFFRNVLRRNPHQNPLLYLKGVKYKELLSVLNFMYQGEVNVAQEELNSFLAVAEELKVKGLTQSSSESGKQDTSSGGSSNSTSRSAGSSNRSREPPDRDASSVGGGGSSSQPAAKRPRPSLPDSGNNFSSASPAKSLRKSPSILQSSARHHDADTYDDDDIQEVMPVVKSEPSASLHAVTPMDDASYRLSGGDGGGGDGGSGGGGGGGTVALEESYQDDGYDYEGYDDTGAYDDGSGGGGYDPATGLPLAGGGDGNKAEVSELSYRSSEDHLWYCRACPYTAKGSTDMFRHVDARHLLTGGYACPHCLKTAPSQNALRVHIIRKHKPLQ